MEEVHVKKTFTVFVPFDGEETIFELDPHPSVLLVYGPIRIALGVRLFYKQNLTSIEYEQQGICWATKLPFSFRKRTDEHPHSGLLLQLKVKQGVFDFSTIGKNFVRIQIDCRNAEGQVINSATTEYIQLLPRKRNSSGADLDRLLVLPVHWKTAGNSTNALQSTETPQSTSLAQVGYRVTDSEAASATGVIEAEYDRRTSTCSEEEQNPSDDAVQHSREELMEQRNEQYMVLYNGDAKVVGNFRALNFYKASDINLKEDIRLLSDDPRSVLLRIDGVSYKFKPGTTHSTNKRFVGYIAQQIESVVPEAVQLIDGILHVDYESLIPYLSESIKQNYDHLKDIKADQQRIEAIIDILYKDFMKREAESSQMSIGVKKETTCTPQRVLIAVFSVVMTVAVLMIGLYFVADQSVEDNLSPAPTPITVLTPTSTPLPVTPGSPTSTPSAGFSPLPPISAPAPFISPPIASKNSDREALKDLYEATNGEYWEVLLPGYDWLSSAPLCEWVGVKCENGRVIEIQLSFSKLQGTIPPTIYKLDALQSLSLANNLSGIIPLSIGWMTTLQYLDLADNPSLSGNVPDAPMSLKVMSLYKCNLSGTIPATIVNMTELYSLVLASNQLNGTIPALPSKLEGIDLSNNRLEGTIPQFVSSELSWLNVANNSLAGSLENLADLNLERVNLANNNFSGELNWFNMSKVHTLIVDNNQFTSYNGTYFPPQLQSCSAKGNPFRCPVPGWLRSYCKAKCK